MLRTAANGNAKSKRRYHAMEGNAKTDAAIENAARALFGAMWTLVPKTRVMMTALRVAVRYARVLDVIAVGWRENPEKEREGLRKLGIDI